MNIKRKFFCVSLFLALLLCILGNNRDHRSSQCFIQCVNTFHENLHESLSEYESIDKLHGISLRSFLRKADSEDLQQFCSSIYEPFLICMTKCPKTLGRDWGIWDYRALSHICMDHLEEFKSGMSCLNSASAESDQECSNEIQNHQRFFDYVEDYLDNRLSEDHAGEQVVSILNSFCPTVSDLMNCEQPILENYCTADIARNEADLIYMFLGTVQSRLYAAKLMQFYPQSCKTIYDQHFFGAPKTFHYPESGEETTTHPSSSTSTSQCFTSCVSEFHVRTELDSPKFSQIDELHGLNLRQFLRNSDVNELDHYCKNIYTPFLNCIVKCPKNIGRDWGIWDYRALTSICIDHLDEFTNNFKCLREMEDDNNIKVCRNERANHARLLSEVEIDLHLPTDHIEHKLQEFCSSLETLLKCEHPVEVKRCGVTITTLEQDLHYMYLGQVQSRLHVSQLDHRFPSNCRQMYEAFLNPSVGSVGHGQVSSQCVIDCVIGYRNFTHRKQFKRFDLADKQYGVDLRRFIRKTYSEELRAYCNEAFTPFVMCLTKCPKSIGRDITSWDYIALTHVCVDHLDEFADNRVCLERMEDPNICKNQSEKHQQLFTDLQILVDDHLYEPNTGSRLEHLLTEYCPKLNDLISCERPLIAEQCSEAAADMEHKLVIMYLATVKGRMVNAHLESHIPINCTQLYDRLGISSDANCLHHFFCFFITFLSITFTSIVPFV